MTEQTKATPPISASTTPTSPPTRAGPPEPSNPKSPWGLKDTFRWLEATTRYLTAQPHRVTTYGDRFETKHFRIGQTSNHRSYLLWPWDWRCSQTTRRSTSSTRSGDKHAHNTEQAQEDETADTPTDKRPTESQAWSMDRWRHQTSTWNSTTATSHSPIQTTQPPKSITTNKEPSHTQHSQSNHTPTEDCTSTQTATTTRAQNTQTNQSNKTAPHTPVKAMPSNRPTLTHTTHKHQAKNTPTEPHTPAPKRRRAKTTPSQTSPTMNHTELSVEDVNTDNPEACVEEEIFHQFAEEDSPPIPSPEYEPPLGTSEPVKKKRRRHWSETY